MLAIEFQLTKMQNRITNAILRVACIYLRWVYRVTEYPRRSTDVRVRHQNVNLNRHLNKGTPVEKWIPANIRKTDISPVTRAFLFFFVPMFYLVHLFSKMTRRNSSSSDLGRVSEYVYEGFTD